MALTAAAVCLILEVLLLAATSHDPSAPGGFGRSVFRIAVTVLVLVAFAARFPIVGGIGSAILFVPAGLYFLGAENVFLSIGVAHLVMMAAGLILALPHRSHA